VLAGSPADRDGRIQKGDRILSINGRSMKGVTHRESLNILKVRRHLTLFCLRKETVTCVTLVSGSLCTVWIFVWYLAGYDTQM
jgi:C-terminal processing protease CtpA/Prc